MGVQDSVSWYQKKIGTYDKQQWEKTVEQRILHGLTHVMKKTAKLKTDLIDVDLVRGSSFPKAKPKHGIITVTKLAFIRSLFLPLYSYWWIEQTCLGIFCLLLLLYVLQLSNMIVYFSSNDEQIFKHISSYEILVPAGMMLVLSIIHSQIVSTNNSSENFSKSRSKRRRIKRRNFSFDCKTEVYSSKESILSSISGKSKRSFKIESVDENSVRRKNIGWCIPLQNITEMKDSENNDETEEGPDRKEIFRNNAVQIEDDGFESLNSNGSSENGDENPEGNQADHGTTDEESEGKGEGKEDGDVKCNERDLDESLGCSKDCSCNMREVEREDGCACHKDARISPKEVEEERSEKSFPDLLRRRSASGLLSTCEICDHETDHKDTDSDVSNGKLRNKKSTSPQRLLQRRRGSLTFQAKASQSSFYNSSCESDDGDRFDSPNLNEGTTSAAEWIGITTNSEECSVTSEIEESDSPNGNKVLDDHPFAWEFQLSPSILSPSCASSDKVSCTIWENNEVKRADLSVLDISSAIIARVERMRESMDYFYAEKVKMLSMTDVYGEGVLTVRQCQNWFAKFRSGNFDVEDAPRSGRPVEADKDAIKALVDANRRIITQEIGIFVSVVISFLPSLRRLFEITQDTSASSGETSHHMDPILSLSAIELTDGFFTKFLRNVITFADTAFGSNLMERFIILSAMLERFLLSALFFFLVAVAERTFKQRFLYAKFFSRLTSFRRARKSELPHFRLNKVRNIKTWLSVRSYLKKRGPQRSVDVIVSTAFIITLLLLSFLSVELLKDSMRLHSEWNLEAVVWCLVLGVYLLRFMTLGNKTNRKYRNLSVLLTEQINLYLQIEQKPHKKEELMVANSVLKLAADLLKELECPFKISGLSANPYIYTITKVVILSALSGVLSELLGFKLKLHKIKIK